MNKDKLEQLFYSMASPKERAIYKAKKEKERLAILAQLELKTKKTNEIKQNFNELAQKIEKTKGSIEEDVGLELFKLSQEIEKLKQVVPPKGDQGEPGKDGTEIEGEEIVKKINDLEVTPEKQIDAKHIKNFPWDAIKKAGNDLIAWGMGGTWLNGQTTTNSTLTVSTTAPSDPAVNDLWYDIS